MNRWTVAISLLLTGTSLAAQSVKPAEAPAMFVARTVDAEPGAREAYLQCLREVALPSWRKLHAEGQLLQNAVYEKAGELNALAGPDWQFLVVSRVRDGSRAPGNEAASCEQLAGVRLIRAEAMRATPASFHPAEQNATRRPDLAFLIEFIAVQSARAALDAYRETMRTSIGPATGQLVLEGSLFNMIALESTAPKSRAEPGFNWNQIHIRGYYPELGPTPAAMTIYMQRLNPERGDFAAVFKRLDSIRSTPRDNVAREHVELAV